MFANPNSRVVPLRAQGNYVFNTATNLWVPQPGDGVNGNYVQGAVASGVADAGNPVKTGGKYNSTLPTLSDGQRGDFQIGVHGCTRVELFQSGSLFPLVSGTASDGGGAANPTLFVATQAELYNGSSWDRVRGNVDTGALVTLTTSASGTTNSADQINYNGRGVQILVNITATTAQTLTVSIQGKDTASGVYYNLLTTTALAAVAATNITVYPGITVSANLDISDVLPRTWRVSAVVSGAGTTLSATIGASIIL